MCYLKSKKQGNDILGNELIFRYISNYCHNIQFTLNTINKFISLLDKKEIVLWFKGVTLEAALTSQTRSTLSCFSHLDNYISIVYQLPRLRHSVIAEQTS